MTSPGTAARVREWWRALIAGELGAPPEVLSKLRVAEGVLPFLAATFGLSARSIVDLIPDDDDNATLLLGLVHDWTGAMLTPPAAALDAGDVVEGTATELPA